MYLELNLSWGQRSERSACITRCKEWSVFRGGYGVWRQARVQVMKLWWDVRVQLQLRLSGRDSRSPSRSHPCRQRRHGK